MHDVIVNKRLLIVGGTSGIGLAVAKQASQRGAIVIAVSRNPEQHKAVCNELRDGSIETHAMDIINPDEHHRLFQAIGAIDHLIVAVRPEANAGPFLSLDASGARRAFETKFWGPYQLIQVAHSHIRETGSITLTSGIAGEKIYESASTMALINSATETLCRILAVDLAPLRVNVVSPGFVGPKPESVRKFANEFPAGRLATPDEVATAYLAVIANQYVTGTVTVVDGGARFV